MSQQDEKGFCPKGNHGLNSTRKEITFSQLEWDGKEINKEMTASRILDCFFFII